MVGNNEPGSTMKCEINVESKIRYAFRIFSLLFIIFQIYVQTHSTQLIIHCAKHALQSCSTKKHRKILDATLQNFQIFQQLYKIFI